MGGRDVLFNELVAVSGALGAVGRGEESVVVYLLLRSFGLRGGWERLGLGLGLGLFEEGGIAVDEHEDVVVGRVAGGEVGGELVLASADALFEERGGGEDWDHKDVYFSEAEELHEGHVSE